MDCEKYRSVLKYALEVMLHITHFYHVCVAAYQLHTGLYVFFKLYLQIWCGPNIDPVEF